MGIVHLKHVLGGYGHLRVFPVLFKFGFRFSVVWVALSPVGGLFVSLFGIWQTDLKINPLKTKRRLLYLRPRSYRAVNTFHLGYKNQSVYAVSGTSRCLFSDKPFKDEAQTALFKDPVRTVL